MFKTVLVAVDGSSHAQKALAAAAEIAVKFRARVVLVHTLLRDQAPEDLRRIPEMKGLSKALRAELLRIERMPVSLAAMGAGDVHIPVPREVLEGLGQQILKNARAVVTRKGVKNVTTKLESGDPATRLLARAKSERANLIVLGSRGFGRLKGILMGSVSQKVGQLATCACLTVK